jgi:hypothetical protein
MSHRLEATDLGSPLEVVLVTFDAGAAVLTAGSPRVAGSFAYVHDNLDTHAGTKEQVGFRTDELDAHGNSLNHFGIVSTRIVRWEEAESRAGRGADALDFTVELHSRIRIYGERGRLPHTHGGELGHARS